MRPARLAGNQTAQIETMKTALDLLLHLVDAAGIERGDGYARRQRRSEDDISSGEPQKQKTL